MEFFGVTDRGIYDFAFWIYFKSDVGNLKREFERNTYRSFLAELRIISFIYVSKKEDVQRILHISLASVFTCDSLRQKLIIISIICIKF